MRQIVPLLAVLALGLAPLPFRKPDPVKTDLRKLQGEWVQTGSSHGRGPVQPHKGADSAVFTGDRISFRTNGRQTAGWTVVLGPEGSTRTLDLKDEAGRQFLLGLYRLEGDRFTFCFRNAMNAADRPTDLEPREGWIVMVYERKKP